MSALERIREEVEQKPLLVASAPGRADFLNTHQDYKGLPVVPIAINLRTYAVAVEELEGKFIVESLNLKREGVKYRDEFSVPEASLRGGRWFGDYLRAVVIAVENATGFRFEKGLRVIVDTDIPIGSGLGSSAALEVAFAKLLDGYFNIGLTKKRMAEICYIAENRVLGIPCGRLDQYASSYGGAILLNTRPPFDVEELPLHKIKLVVADSGIRHSVLEVHPKRQEEINRALRQLMDMNLPRELRKKLGRRFDEPQWELISLDELGPFLASINKKYADRIRFTIIMHRYTMLAVKLIKKKKLKKEELAELGLSKKAHWLEVLGVILNKQHELLRDLYEVSHPVLEKMRNAMLEAGALGVKISGAGMGGSLIALVADDETAVKVADAALQAGAANSWRVFVDEGARLERVSW